MIIHSPKHQGNMLSQRNCFRYISMKVIAFIVSHVRYIILWRLALKMLLNLQSTLIGELLTTREARRRQQIYDKLASDDHFSSALLVVREHLPSGNACLRINIDATRAGNVARFINHSCDGGNLSTILVRSSGALLPRLCFFASKDIKEGEELTFSYGEIRVRPKGSKCFCGSFSCFGTLPSEHT